MLDGTTITLNYILAEENLMKFKKSLCLDIDFNDYVPILKARLLFLMVLVFAVWGRLVSF